MKHKKPETVEEYEEMVRLEEDEKERVVKKYEVAVENMFHVNAIMSFLAKNKWAMVLLLLVYSAVIIYMIFEAAKIGLFS